MRTEKLDPRSRPEPPEGGKPDAHGDEDPRKQREFKDDGRYIIYYDFEDAEA